MNSHFIYQATKPSSMKPQHDASLESKRVSLQDSILLYIESNYGAKIAAGSVFVQGSNISVTITGERPNLRNYWSGKWNSSWTITVSGSSATIVGEIKVCCLFLELFFLKFI